MDPGDCPRVCECCVCECCGEDRDACGCEIRDVAGVDHETGPWAETVCLKHRARV
jgi:hypothetical protein